MQPTEWRGLSGRALPLCIMPSPVSVRVSTAVSRVGVRVNFRTCVAT